MPAQDQHLHEPTRCTYAATANNFLRHEPMNKAPTITLRKLKKESDCATRARLLACHSRHHQSQGTLPALPTYR